MSAMEMVTPKKLLNDPNTPVFVQTRSNGFKFVSADINDALSGFVGIEYECGFSPSAKQRRALHEFLEKNVADWGEIARRYSDNHTILQAKMRSGIASLLHEQTDLLHKEPHFDGGGLESVFHPMTLRAYEVLHEEFVRVLRMYEQYGFTPNVPGAGIHTNIDLALFGNTADQIEEGVKNFLWFLFKESEWMVDFSQRQYGEQINSDMLTLLGDPLGLLSEEELLARFYDAKENILNALVIQEGEEEYDEWEPWVAFNTRKWLNIGVRRDNRPALEFRWFGTTLSELMFMAMAQFSFAMPAWCQTLPNTDAVSLQNFQNFVEANMDDYGALYQVMVSMKQTSSAEMPAVAEQNLHTIEVGVPA